MNDLVIYLVIVPVALLVGLIIGYAIAHYIFKKEVKKWQKQMVEPDKEQVKNMLSALGRKPSEEQVNRFINLTKKQQAKKPIKATKKKRK